MVLVKNSLFFHLLFLGKRAKENIFYDILEQQNAYLGHKKFNFKKLKKLRYFQMG